MHRHSNRTRIPALIYFCQKSSAMLKQVIDQAERAGSANKNSHFHVMFYLHLDRGHNLVIYVPTCLCAYYPKSGGNIVLVLLVIAMLN